MTKQLSYESTGSEVWRGAEAHSGTRQLQQTQGRKVPHAGDEPAASRNLISNAWAERSLRRVASPQRWIVDEAAGPALGGDCLNTTDLICPKLVEAQAAKVLAERQLVEATHRQANVLQMIVSGIARQRRMQDDIVAQGEFDQLIVRVQAAAQLSRYLLPPRKLVRVDIGALLRNVAAAIGSVTGLVCEVEAESVTMPGQVAMHLATAVNELAWNAFKHAYSGAGGGVIRITCYRDAEACLLLSVTDQGRGFPSDFDPRASQGIGLTIVYAITRQFGGKIRLESDRGARLTLLLPIHRCEADVP